MRLTHRDNWCPSNTKRLLVGDLFPHAGTEHEVEGIPHSAIEEAVTHQDEHCRQEGEYRKEVVEDLQIFWDGKDSENPGGPKQRQK